MKRMAIAMLLLASTAAYGADLSTAGLIAKAPPVIPTISWTGFYLGANVGGGWGTTQTAVDNIAVSNITSQGILGGVQGGFNYQLGNIVMGLEADGEWTGISGTGPCTAGLIIGCTQTNKLKWEADVAGRLGYSFDKFLPYIKGGWAWGNLTRSASVPVGHINNGNAYDVASQSDTRSGWLLGVGLEYAISNHWSAKLEYNFIDFGTQNTSVVFTGPGLGNRPFTLNNVSFKDEYQTVKAGINYKF
jgi:outer membrane immunogenic protein